MPIPNWSQFGFQTAFWAYKLNADAMKVPVQFGFRIWIDVARPNPKYFEFWCFSVQQSAEIQSFSCSFFWHFLILNILALKFGLNMSKSRTFGLVPNVQKLNLRFSKRPKSKCLIWLNVQKPTKSVPNQFGTGFCIQKFGPEIRQIRRIWGHWFQSSLSYFVWFSDVCD